MIFLSDSPFGEMSNYTDVQARRITMEYKENPIICNCMQVSLSDIDNALHQHEKFSSVEEEFKRVQEATHCSTGCGGCHDKVMDIISQMMNGMLH